MNIRLCLSRLLTFASASLLVVCAQAAVTDISSVPLIIASPSSVQPNLMFVLDDSGSMNFDYLPDLVNGTTALNKTSGDFHLCRSAGATSSTATGTFDASCCTNNNESTACWVQAKSDAAPFTYRGHPPFLAAGFNGLAYNPATTYTPPVDYTGTSAPNVSTYTSVKNDYYGIQSTTSIDLTSQFPDLEWCTDGYFYDCLRNGNYVLPGTVNGKNYTTSHNTTGTGNGFLAVGAPESAAAVAQTFGPYYYNIIPNEYCDGVDLRNCQIGQSDTFSYPAKVRWCDTDAHSQLQTPPANACQAVANAKHQYSRYPTRYPSVVTGGSAAVTRTAVAAKTTIAFTLTNCNNSNKSSVSQITVNGINLMSAATNSTSSANTTVTNVQSAINSGGFTAAYSTSVTPPTVTITAPISLGNINNVSAAITFSNGGTCGISTTGGTFSGYVDRVTTPAVAGSPAARFERVDIIPGRASYPRAATRTDCADASSCTYKEEMTNFANWWTYYHSRMQMMKSATMLAFDGVPTNYRVGYMTINGNQSKAFLNPLTFGAKSTARQTWWSKLTAAVPNNSTPLRTALAAVGRYYAGQFNGLKIPLGSSDYGVVAIDPIQYSCQKNFLLLSTDGFWNESATPVGLDGNAVGDQDSGLPRPQKDGNKASNTLADAAAYYYATDLRTGKNSDALCLSANTDDAGKYTGNDTCGNKDTDPVQRMSTFTLGLGASGNMQFRSDYATATSGDYYDVAQGSTPGGAVCAWQASGACTWPVPVSNGLTTIDDLWHAAVNGHGTYFSATSPSSLYTGLSSALSAIDNVLAASAAVTTSVPNITATDNSAFLSNFNSGVWSGELQAHTVATTGANVGTIDSTVVWSASNLLTAKDYTTRKIYMYGAGKANNLRTFDWASLTSTEQAYFSTSVMVSGGLQQFCTTGSACLSSANQAAAGGSKLVSFLQGDRSNEGDISTTTKYFRQRTSVLGDIVDSEAIYVGQPTLHLSDPGYSDFKAKDTVVKRAGVVYVGANDGMLHAFDAKTGAELWAYVPASVLPNLYKLADKAYGNKHQYFVDASPVVHDFYDGSNWRTLLVSGLGAGGRAYFAIDITDPANPIPLWEFTEKNLGQATFDPNLGYTMGKAEIVKLPNTSPAQWAVILPSGYNNVSPGDGQGRLFVLDALTGVAPSGFAGGIATTAVAKLLPSNLGHIRAWADNADIDSTALRVYGGDDLGNVWRFNVNGAPKTIGSQLLATLMAADGTSQPVSSRPELGSVGNIAMVYVGTGRYLGLIDIGDKTQQSIYGIKDTLDLPTATSWGNPRSPSVNQFVKQTLSDIDPVTKLAATCPTGLTICTGQLVRTNGDPQPVNLVKDDGWYVDLPATYERDNTDPVLVGGILVVNTNVIDNSKVCTVGGSSWQNFFDYSTGGAVAGNQNVVSTFLGNAIATRPNVVAINGKLYTQTTLSNNQHPTNGPLTAPNNQTARRTSWRELPTQ